MRKNVLTDQLAGKITAEDFEGWSDELRREFVEMANNTNVGNKLISETDETKVWYIDLGPGERLPAHLHTNDYFWTVLRAGESIQHQDDGTTRRVSYELLETRHVTFQQGEYLLHDLCNVGDGHLEFLTVEHIKDGVR